MAWTGSLPRRLPGRSDRGFSLVELIVVVSIIGILLGVAIPTFMASRSRATLVACKSDARTVYVAVTAYNLQTGGTPVATAALLTGGSTPYLQSIPPASVSCAISLLDGVVMLAAPSSATPVVYDPTSVTGGTTVAAGVGGTTTSATTVASTTTTVAALGTPTGVTATCLSSSDKRIVVTWTAVPRAISYSVVNSTTSATTGFTEIASYVAGTSFTTGGLGYSTQWFQVIAHMGATSGANSVASNSRQITNAPGCV